MTPNQRLSRADRLVGLPFVVLPGAPRDYVVAGEMHGGRKLRVAAVEQCWNDMLLTDGIEGPGEYLKRAGPVETACIEVGERLYGTTAAECLEVWLQLPRFTGAYEWPGRSN